MAQIIEFPNDRIKTAKISQTVRVEKPTCRQDYLNLMKIHLIGDDYEDLLLCIMDKDYYETADEETIKKLVDNYFELKD